MSKYWRFFLRWKVICFAFTLRALMSTLFPTRTMGMCSQTRIRSRCQLGTLLYVMREVTSNMMIAQCASMLRAAAAAGQDGVTWGAVRGVRARAP